MDGSSNSGKNARPLRAKQTLLLDWYGRSWKETVSEAAGREADREVQSFDSNLNLRDSSGKDIGCQEPGPDALELETPLAKKIRDTVS